MNKQDQFFEEPGIDGPDYVALVIEWDELADSIEDEITLKTETPKAPIAFRPARWMVAAAIGLFGMLGLATWGVTRRLRAA